MRSNKGWNSYLFDYYHDGAWWCIEICAQSKEDARERVDKLPHAKYVGEIQMTFPVELGVIAKLLCWWKNFTRLFPL